MTRIWITDWAFDFRDNGVVAVDVPDELIPDDNRFLKLPREILKPWRWPNVFINVGVYRWYRSEEAARDALKREIERRIRKAKRDLLEAQKHLADFKENGLPMALTVAERKEARRRKSIAREESK